MDRTAPDAPHAEQAPPQLSSVLLDLPRHPLRLLQDWNWKSASFSAIIRGCMFFLTNLRAGQHRAGKAMVAEMVYAIAAAGLFGATVQRLRNAVPRARTALVIWVLLPLLLLGLEALWHYALGTPRLKTSMIASFILAAFGTGFNWFAMSRGVLVTGQGHAFSRDLARIPGLLAEFVLALPRLAFRLLFRR